MCGKLCKSETSESETSSPECPSPKRPQSKMFVYPLNHTCLNINTVTSDKHITLKQLRMTSRPIWHFVPKM